MPLSTIVTIMVYCEQSSLAGGVGGLQLTDTDTVSLTTV